ncbi:acyltransferase family protein [Arcicella sp. LKC2W]|uniref:acyltransferase n=1 Tax=Arcicella sp. LKC2W TaxID=2984198 RepID=UPI002B211AC2|nr:acyltransferase family protein [Arcicella sp. LKC2W]MEA5461397.1 acyltransferase family protein [Arcicella sp. LKC2W]
MPKIYWISNLRVFATLIVVLLHTASNGVYHFGKMPVDSWWICNIINTFGRFAVPVFVILSGYLLLDRYDNLATFLSKRFSRIFVPFLIWLFIYMIHGTFKGIKAEQVNWLSVDWIVRILTNNASGSGQLWFVYMLLGLYLFTPVLSRWFVAAPKNEVLFFLGMWFVANSCFLVLEKTMNIKPYFDFRYFTGFAGYFVLGAYLKKYPILPSAQILLLAIALFLIGWISTMFTVEFFSKQAGKYMDLLGYHSPLVVMMSLGIVLFFQQILNKPFAEKIIGEIDASSYGIFLFHWLVMKILSRDFKINFSMYPNPIPGMLLHFILTTVICIIVIGIIRRLPKGHWITG